MAGFRTVVIDKRVKLDLRMNYMVLRSSDNTEHSIFIDEIDVLFIESQAVSLTAALIAELIKKEVTIIFADEKHLPLAATINLNGHYSVSKNIKKQIAWTEESKHDCWVQIIKEKIKQQALFLKDLDKIDAYDSIQNILAEMTNNNVPLIEARCASTYFKALFGSGFTRQQSSITNTSLNYGYGLLLSKFANNITICGYLPELGLWHSNQENTFNLASDLMEPFRIIVDRIVYKNKDLDNKSFKRKMSDIFNWIVYINNANQYLSAAIKIYTHRIFNILNKEENMDSIFPFTIIGEDHSCN